MSLFLECDSVIRGCNTCSYGGASMSGTSTKLSYFNCASCQDGLFLWSNTTTTYDYQIPFTACVSNCEIVNPSYTSDPITRACVSCGPNCKSCKLNGGCSDCDSDSGYTKKTTSVCLACTNQKICSTCDSTNTDSCDACFSEYDSGLCSQGTSFTVSNNKYISDSNSALFECVNGYSNDGSGSCQACSVSNCLTCSTSGSTCLDCAQSYYLDSGTCKYCISCSSGSSCDACASGFIYTNGIGTQSCVNMCPIGYYGAKTYKSFGRVVSSTCQQCDSSCKTCAGDLDSQCTSCPKDYYLQLSDVSLTYGTCVGKVSGSPSQIIVYVKPDQITPDSGIQSLDGSYDYPYNNLFDAIERAFELGAPYYDASITIKMFTGTHYVRRAVTTLYQALKIDRDSQNIDMLIRPLYCSDSESNIGSICSVEDTIGVNIINKIRSQFVIPISKSLLFQDIQVDSLDSILSYTTAGVAEDSCLSTFAQCCKISSTQTIVSDTSSSKCEKQGTSLLYYTTDRCYSSRGASVFKFTKSSSTQLSGTTPQSLTIQNCVFKNFLYEFNSFIEMNEWGALITIQSTTFDSISNCGALIRNFYQTINVGDFDPSYVATTDSGKIDQVDLFTRNFQLQTAVQAYIDSDNIDTPLTCSTDETDTVSQQCFQILIDSSFFQYFNKYKTHTTPAVINKDSNLRYLGQILNLKNFKGKITFTSNSLSDNQLAYGTCDTASDIYSAYEENQSFSAIANRDHTQIRNLISIIGTNHLIYISDNEFSTCSSVKGLIFIESDNRVNPVIIQSNSFLWNQAYFSALAIYIRAKSGQSSPLLTEIDFKTETDMQCGGYLLKENIFFFNTVCPNYGQSIVEFECVEQDYTLNANDEYNLEYSFPDDETNLEYFKENTELYKSIEFNEVDAEFGVKMKQVSFQGNSYTDNYASGLKGILSIRGAHFFEMVDESFSNNGDSFDELFSGMGGQFAATNVYKYAGFYYDTMKAMIFLDQVFYPKITNLEISGGFKLLDTYSSDFAQVLFMANSRGPFILDSCSFSDLFGLGYDYSSADDGFNTNPVYISDQSLIGFSETYISAYEFIDLALSSIIMKGSSSILYYNHPYLIAPDSGSVQFYYDGDQQYYYASASVLFTNLVMSDVSCVSCTNFMFIFASHDFKIDSAIISNVNPSNKNDEDESRSGIFGFAHVQIDSVLSLNLVTSSEFTDINGSILRIVHYNSNDAPEYLIDYNTFDTINCLSMRGGIISYKIYDDSVSVASLKFDSNEIKTVTQVNSVSGLMGGVVYAINLLEFSATSNTFYAVSLIAGRGDIFYLMTYSGDGLTVTLADNEANNLQQQIDYYDNDVIIIYLQSVTFADNYAPFYIQSDQGDIKVDSSNNYFENSEMKTFGGFIYIINNSGNSNSIVTEFIDTNSYYSGGIAQYGGAIYCVMCTKVEVTDSTFYYGWSKYGGGIALTFDNADEYMEGVEIDFITTLFDENSATYSGGGIYIGEKKGIKSGQSTQYTNVILTLTTVTGTVNLGNYQTEASTGRGGFAYIQTESLYLTDDGGKYNYNTAQEGGWVYIETYNDTNGKQSEIHIESTTITLAYAALGNGAVMMVVSPECILISISDGDFSGFLSSVDDPGQLFKISHTGSSYHTLQISGASKFHDITTSIANGGVLNLLKVKATMEGGLQFKNIKSKNGGVFYLSSSSITVTDASFSQIQASAYGGIVYADTSYDSFYYFDDCYIETITSLQGGMFYDLSPCTYYGQDIRGIENSDIKTIQVSVGATLGYISAENCQIMIMTSDMYNIDMPTSAITVNNANYFTIEKAGKFIIESMNIKDIDVDSNTVEAFLYSAYSGLTVTITDTYIECRQDYSLSQTSASYSSVIYLENSKEFYSYDNWVNNCNLGKFGIYYLNGVKTITDEESWYYNNTALAGGVYYIVGSVSAKTTGTFIDCIYEVNFGSLGGVFAMYDYFDITLTDNTFNNNLAGKGGILYVTELQQGSNPSSMTFSANNIYNNTATQQGGIAWLSHSLLQLTVTKTNIYLNYAPTGGVFYISSLRSLTLSYSQIYQNEAFDGSILYSTASSATFQISLNTFIGDMSFNYAQAMANIIAQTYNRTTAMYFSSASTKVIASENNYRYFFNNQRGGVYLLDGVTFAEDSGIYKNNSALIGGAIYCTKCALTTVSNQFTYNLAFQGGSIYVESDSSYSSRFDQFQKNTAYTLGGALFATTRSVFTILNGKFIQNYANSDATISALMTSTSKRFLIKTCQFSNNVAVSNLMSFKLSDGDIQDSIFLNNKASVQTNNIFISFGSLNITNSKFQDTTILNATKEVQTKQVTGAHIYISLGVTLNSSNCLFDSGLSSQGGAIYINGLSTVNFYSATFTNNYAKSSGGVIYAQGFQEVGIYNTIFQNNMAYTEGSEFYGLFSSYQAIFSNVQIINPAAVSSLYCDTVSLKAYKLSISNNLGQSEKGGGITCINCGTFNVDQSIFTNLKSKEGGAIYLEQADSSKVSAKAPTYSLTNSIIQSSSSYLGGGMYLNNIEYMDISNSSFTLNKVSNNSAMEISGYGGGVYFTCQNSYMCAVTIRSNTQFTSNSADNSGGGIKWDAIEPLFQSQSFSGNKAALYGDDIGSFAQKIIQITKEQYLSQVNKNKGVRVLAGTSDSTSSSISGQQSGGNIPDILLALADKYNNIVGNTNSAKLTLRVDTTYNGNNPSSTKYAAVLEGNSQFTSLAGVFNASGVSFAATPGYTFKILFDTDGIDNTKPSNSAYLSSLNSTSTTTDFPIYISLRQCQVGEAFSDAGKCTACSNGTSYLLDAMTSPGTCKTCPSEAKCMGGSNIGPLPGYWRTTNTTSNFIKCPNAAACVGMVAPDYNPQGDCADKYKGILCADCTPNYSRNADYQCAKCPPNGTNATRLFFIFVALICGVIFLIRSTLKGAREKKNVTSIYTKILMNHIQLILLTASFNFKWPEFVLKFFSVSAPVAQVGDQIFSIDCFLNQQSSPSSNSTQEDSSSQLSTSHDFFRVFYVKLLMFAILPILIFLICYSVWGVIAWRTKDYSKLKTRAISSLVIVLFLVHPNIVQYMFSVFNCFQVEDQSRVYADLQIICYTGAHFFWALCVALPALIVWGLGIPFFAYILLTREKAKLGTMELKEKFGFLFNGYKKEFYYWEVVIMYRKILMIVIAVIIKSFGVITQALIVFLFLIFYLIMNLKKKPFSQVALNDLETTSLVTSMISIYCGIFFISDMSNVDFSDNKEFQAIDNGLRLTPAVRLFFFACIVIVNGFFFALWLYKMYIETKAMMVKKMQKLYLILCLCMNRQKLEIKIKQSYIDEENELLREDYMKTVRKLKELYNDGELVLTRVILEKLQIYLSKEHVLKIAKQFKENKPKPEEVIKSNKRKNRKQQFMKNMKNSASKVQDQKSQQFDNFHELDIQIDNFDISIPRIQIYHNDYYDESNFIYKSVSAKHSRSQSTETVEEHKMSNTFVEKDLSYQANQQLEDEQLRLNSELKIGQQLTDIEKYLKLSQTSRDLSNIEGHFKNTKDLVEQLGQSGIQKSKTVRNVEMNMKNDQHDIIMGEEDQIARGIEIKMKHNNFFTKYLNKTHSKVPQDRLVPNNAVTIMKPSSYLEKQRVKKSSYINLDYNKNHPYKKKRMTVLSPTAYDIQKSLDLIVDIDDDDDDARSSNRDNANESKIQEQDNYRSELPSISIAESDLHNKHSFLEEIKEQEDSQNINDSLRLESSCRGLIVKKKTIEERAHNKEYNDYSEIGIGNESAKRFIQQDDDILMTSQSIDKKNVNPLEFQNEEDISFGEGNT